MTKCPDCNLEMLEADSCTISYMTTTIDKKQYERRKDWHDDGTGRCHDCGIKEGGFHHLGCDVERCARCRGQLISCGCWEE